MKHHANLTGRKAPGWPFSLARHTALHESALHWSALLLATLLFSHSATWAKSADNNAPVHIEADQMEMREKDDISIGYYPEQKGPALQYKNKRSAGHVFPDNGPE